MWQRRLFRDLLILILGLCCSCAGGDDDAGVQQTDLAAEEIARLGVAVDRCEELDQKAWTAEVAAAYEEPLAIARGFLASGNSGSLIREAGHLAVRCLDRQGRYGEMARTAGEVATLLFRWSDADGAAEFIETASERIFREEHYRYRALFRESAYAHYAVGLQGLLSAEEMSGLAKEYLQKGNCASAAELYARVIQDSPSAGNVIAAARARLLAGWGNASGVPPHVRSIRTERELKIALADYNAWRDRTYDDVRKAVDIYRRLGGLEQSGHEAAVAAKEFSRLEDLLATRKYRIGLVPDFWDMGRRLDEPLASDEASWPNLAGSDEMVEFYLYRLVGGLDAGDDEQLEGAARGLARSWAGSFSEERAKALSDRVVAFVRAMATGDKELFREVGIDDFVSEHFEILLSYHVRGVELSRASVNTSDGVSAASVRLPVVNELGHRLMLTIDFLGDEEKTWRCDRFEFSGPAVSAIPGDLTVQSHE